MKRLADFRKQVIEGWTVQRIAFVLIVVGLVVFVVGLVNKHCACAGLPNLGETLNDTISDFYANVSVDCLSVAFAILVIDRLNERRAERELRERLIREMGHPTDNGITHQAVRELRAQGWLMDGSLKRASLISANLQGTDLRGSNLQDAHLVGSNLKGARLVKANLQSADLAMANLREANLLSADLQGAHLVSATFHESDMMGANLRGARALTDEQLAKAVTLRDAIMPDANRYNGRFNLKNDIASATRSWPSINPNDDEAMAEFYGVTLEDYLAGQEWARGNLPRLRREAGLDPDTGEPLPATNGVEPQPADAPARPAPRRNGQHKASMVTHRVRR